MSAKFDYIYSNTTLFLLKTDEEYRLVKSRVARQHPANLLQGIVQGSQELARGLLSAAISIFSCAHSKFLRLMLTTIFHLFNFRFCNRCFLIKVLKTFHSLLK